METVHFFFSDLTAYPDISLERQHMTFSVCSRALTQPLFLLPFKGTDEDSDIFFFCLHVIFNGLNCHNSGEIYVNKLNFSFFLLDISPLSPSQPNQSARSCHFYAKNTYFLKNTPKAKWSEVHHCISCDFDIPGVEAMWAGHWYKDGHARGSHA